MEKLRYATRLPEVYTMTFKAWQQQYAKDMEEPHALELYLGFMNQALEEGHTLDAIVLADLASHGLVWPVARYLKQRADISLNKKFKKLFGDSNSIHISRKFSIGDCFPGKSFGNQLSGNSAKSPTKRSSKSAK